MSVYKFLEISTIHIPAPTVPESKLIEPYVIAEYNEGYFLYVPTTDEYNNCPSWLVSIFEKAVENDCYHIRIDCDGDDHDDLIKFDW